VSIQEHWLFTFEKQKLIDYCLENNYTCFLKCCDEMEPISPKIRTRGFGGSGILSLNVDIVAYLCNIVSPVFGAEDSGMMVDSVFASLKCDEMEPISPKIRTRGFGGSGILWRKSLDPFVTKLSDGCVRYTITVKVVKGTIPWVFFWQYKSHFHNILHEKFISNCWFWSNKRCIKITS
jgi:hypothetical protein